MAQRQEHLELMLEELEKYGLVGEISERGKHLEIAWQSPAGRRFIIAPRTPSDWRSSMNCRSDMRKLLRADNLQPVSVSNLSFQKAMALPKEPVLPKEQLIQKDVEALTELVFELQGQIDSMKQYIATALREQLMSMTVVSRVEFQQPKVKLPKEVRETYAEMMAKPVRKTDLVWSLLSSNWKEVRSLVDETGINRAHINTILQKFRREGKVENGLRGQWRRTEN